MRTEEARPDVVVVGAGIVGLATAYFLSERGARVVVLERESIGCAASGAAAGMVSPFAEVDGPPDLDALAHEALLLHHSLAPRLLDETGIDVQFAPLEVLEAAFNEQEAGRLRDRAARADGGRPVRWVDRAEALALEPRLSPRVLGALHAPNEAQVAAYRLSLALARAVEQRGVEIRHGTAVGLLRAGSRIQGVALRSGRVLCPRVVLAAGPWTGRMERWLGFPLPVIPLRGQLLHLHVPGPPLRCCLLHKGGYLLLKGDGVTIAGTTEELVGYRTRPTQAGQAAIRTVALRLAPSMDAAAMVNHTACLRPLSGDSLPVLGPAPGWEGLFLATGHGRRGILLGPLSGRLMAELALDGRSSTPLETFAPSRFLRRRTAQPAASPRHAG